MALDDFNGVRSNIIDEINQVFQTPPTADATLLIGTASKGRLNEILRPNDVTLLDDFGPIPSDPSFDTNLSRGYLEMSRNTVNGADVFVFRVGDATKSFLNLYEYQGSGTNYGALGSGDFAFTQDTVNSELQFSLLNESLIEGGEANGGQILVAAENNIPKAITFVTPDGIRKSFALDPYGRSPNALKNVREIAQIFNNDPDWNKWYLTRYPVLRKTDLSVTVQVDANGGRYVEVDGGTESFGDKLENLEQIAQQLTATIDPVPFGIEAYTLKNTPDKDTIGATATIDTFIRKVKNEDVLTVNATQIGTSSYTRSLFIGNTNARWDGNLGFVYETNSSNANFNNARLFVLRAGQSTKVEVPKLNDSSQQIWWIDLNGQLTIDLTKWTTGTTTFQLGDQWDLDVNYQASYKEANVRSELELGNEFSYFVKGNQIIFGASTSLEVDVIYSSRKTYVDADIDITDFNSIVVYFINAFNRPEVGDTILMTYTYLPELPGESGSVLNVPGGPQVIQRSGFSGGGDGKNVGKMRYKELVADALDLIELYPFRHILIAGAYIDDVVSDYDDETGLPAVVAVDWGTMLLPRITRRSTLVRECQIDLPVRPPLQYTPIAINAWLERLVTNDAGDVGRPANMIDAIQGPGSFRFNCPAGAPILAISQIGGGRQYVGNPAMVIAAMRQDLPLEQSLTNALLPPGVLDLGIKVYSAETLGNLNGKKYTFMTEDVAGNRIIADAPTLSLDGSSYDRQFVVAAVYAAIEVVRATAQRFIGLPRSTDNLIAMKNKAQRNVQYLVPTVFQNVDIRILDVPGGSITGRTKIGLTLITSREIRRVDIETRLSLV